MNKHHRRFGRLLGLTTAVVLPVALLSVVAPAQASPARLGPLKITAASGDQSTLIDFSTLSGQACPAGTSSIQVLMTGGTLTEDLPGFVNGNTDYGLVTGPNGNILATASQTLGQVFSAEAITVLSGTFTIRLQCLDSNLQPTGEFTNTTQWTPTSSGNGTYVAGPTTTLTSTALTVGTPDPVVAATPTSLTATVSSLDAEGTITFKNGATNLSSAITVNDQGKATLDQVVLPVGANNLSAVFTPADPVTYSGSTGTRSYVVAGTPSVTGTTRVGATLTCASAPTAGRAVLWLRNGTSTGVTAPSVVAPASWLNATISCRTTTSKSGGAAPVVLPSAGKKVTVGVAPVARTKPKVLGIAKVGKVLTCSPGAWAPAATSYKYQWFQGTKKLTGKVARTYKAVKANKKKPVTCQVTAIRAGHLSGVAKAPARKVL